MAPPGGLVLGAPGLGSNGLPWAGNGLPWSGPSGRLGLWDVDIGGDEQPRRAPGVHCQTRQGQGGGGQASSDPYTILKLNMFSNPLSLLTQNLSHTCPSLVYFTYQTIEPAPIPDALDCISQSFGRPSQPQCCPESLCTGRLHGARR